MQICKMDNYTKEELNSIIMLSTSLKDFSFKVGYSVCSGGTAKIIKERIKK